MGCGLERRLTYFMRFTVIRSLKNIPRPRKHIQKDFFKWWLVRGWKQGIANHFLNSVLHVKIYMKIKMYLVGTFESNYIHISKIFR